MSSRADVFAREVVAKAFDDAIVFIVGELLRDPAIVENMGAQVEGLPFECKAEVLVAAGAAQHALAAFFSKLQRTGLAKIQLDAGDGKYVDLDDELGEPPLANFFKGGWLSRFSQYGELAEMWQI